MIDVKNRFIAFGDSHIQCFSHLINSVHRFIASSAKGLSNNNSESGVNNVIKSICESSEYDGYIFYFGKVDMDFLLTRQLNINPTINFKEYIDVIIQGYIAFIKGLSIKNVYVCELTYSHVNDADLLVIASLDGHNENINKHLNNEDKNIPLKYTKVHPFKTRIELTQYFNEQLKRYCNENGFTLLEINKYIIEDTIDYKIHDKYLMKESYSHHLVDPPLGELFLKNLL